LAVVHCTHVPALQTGVLPPHWASLVHVDTQV
jgi:hypothetical protein